MAQISSLGAFPLPEPNTPLKTAIARTSGTSALLKSVSPPTTTSTQQTDQAQTSPLQAQISRLSSVLNGLQQNASLTRASYVQASNKVKSGTYTVDPHEVSKSIVEDLLTKQ